ncbi:MAG: TonB-dependent receptor, partial [Geobacteraceae bacterium]|nr:TonB-dependent receptor [Geobacteraceae bacterium]
YSVMAGVHYDLFTDTRLKAAFQRNIRFPSLEQLYSANGGNSSLKTERSYQYEVGVEQKLPGKSLISLTGFRTDAKDFIEKDSNSVNQNFQEYRFYGFEVATQTRFIDNLVMRASYSYLESKDKSDNATKDELQYRPKNKVTFESWYDFAFGLTPYVSVQYVGNQVTYDKNTDSIAYKMKDFTLVNVKLNQKVLNNRLNVYFGVNNIFDENYETSYGFPQAGRFIYGGIGLNI